jgi:sugar-specific transcriptional regulator TrmB
VRIPEEHIENLAKLGLTQTEAKVYITLLCLKRATARSVHEESNIARQEVYRVLSDLEKKDLIKKVIIKPTEFMPISANDAISVLLQRRKDQISQLGENAIQQFRDFEIERAETLAPTSDAQFLLLSKNQANPMSHINKIGRATSIANRSVMVLTTLPILREVKATSEQIWKDAIKRGVKFKFVISRKLTETIELNLDQVLENNDHFKIRWTQMVLPACLILIDEKEAFYRTGWDLNCPVLWSASPSFVALIKDYLNMKWQSLEDDQNSQVY